jgi:cell division protein FtsB
VKRLGILAGAVLVLLALGLLSSIATQGFQDLAGAQAERARLEQRKAELEDRIDALEATLHAVRSDPAAVESLARTELGWIRPGETVILLATPTAPAVEIDLTVATPTPILSLRH